MRMGRAEEHRVDEPMLITSAKSSYDDQYLQRRNKYMIMMGTRVACVIAAALTYTVSIYLALGLLVAGAVLPWCAVLIANDRPPKKRAPTPIHRDLRAERALPPGPSDSRTVDG